MRDLEIWRRLDSGAATTADLAELAALPLSRRGAYVGGALALVTHPDPLVRTAALRVLSGARGVEGVRAIVNALADDDDTVRASALAALRETARDAPMRFAHALFHPRPDVRRAALAETMPQPLAELATYLRADPECRELAEQRARWPANSLALAFGLYSDGHLSPSDLVHVCAANTPAALRQFIEGGHKRPADAVAAYLDTVITRGLAGAGPLPGADLLDHLAGAIVVTAHERRDLTNIHSAIVEARTAIVRRVAAALLSQLARVAGTPELWGLCVALEPRLLAMPDLPTQHLDAIIDALRTTRAGRAPDDQIKRLLALPIVSADLALAAAVVSRASAKRLRMLAEVRGEPAIIASLLADDRGWREICALPQETPSLETGWLARVEAFDYKRYVRLAGICLRTYHGNRQQLFIEQMPRRHRPAVFLSALLASASDTDERVSSLCKVVAPRIERVTLVAILPDLLDTDASGRLALALMRAVTDNVLAAAARDLAIRHLVRIVELVDADPIPRDRELALEKVCTERGIAEVADWCARVTSILSAPVSAVTPIVRKRRELSLSEERAIVGATGRGLDAALAPALGGCVTGLVRALDRPHRSPHIWACVALLSCADRLEDVARLLDMWSEPNDAFAAAVDNAMSTLAHADDLPPLARARLWRWERQQYAFLDWTESIGKASTVLSLADSLRQRFARETLWRAVSEGLMLIRYRDLPRFLSHATLELALYCAERVDEPIGRHAARIVVAFVEAGVVPVSAVRDRVLDRVAEADGETRSYVARLIRLEGVPEVQQAAQPPPVNIVDDIRRSTDVESLATWCLDPRPAVVQEAALALVALGPAGQVRLAAVLAAGGIAAATPILATVVLWDHAPALAAVRSFALRDDLEPSWQFHLSLALLYRGEQDALPRIFAAIRTPTDKWYFRRADWDALIKVADVVTVSTALADSPHHHAYQRSVNMLLSLTRPTPPVHAALVGFLEVDGERPLHLRMAAARFIARHFHDARALPLLVEEVCDPAGADFNRIVDDTPDSAVAQLMTSVVDAALIAGDAACSEVRMQWLVEHVANMMRARPEEVSEARLRIFESSCHAPTRRQAAQRVLLEGEGLTRVRRVAEVFAWGVRRGVELAGRLFKFHLTSTEKDFGHTRLDGNHIFVSPLPMLRGEQHGQDIVEGLVLHEIGHHVYHRGEQAQALWKRAHSEGIGHFLNLIADEHLERNLRAVDPTYGDRLKRLGAYAFQHAPQELKITLLAESLGAATAPALIAAEMSVAYDQDSVRLKRGAILGELDRLGHPVARFSRALRMGLGNRSGESLNAAALALCGKELRQLDMQGLYDLTKRLVEMFGGRVEIAKVFGGPEGLGFGERDDDVFGAGIDDDILQREIERILEPPGAKSGSARGGGRLAINVNPATRFEKITKIVRVQGQPELHRSLVNEVSRHAARLRGYLDELGLRWEPARARTQGRALDKTRLRALVTRNDPRILMARTPLRKTDLFVGTIVDCSGSMQARDNISRARRFAVLVSEAVRQLPGVEARFFGFTDSVIYDAGDKDDCHVTALQAGGGNNDAAALYHAATVALAAPQRAKVLIMISDGLPTECSVAALRNLVTELTRKRGIVCAQVGVIQLTEICFPHYVLIDDDQLDVAVAKFGRMIADLARRSLAS